MTSAIRFLSVAVMALAVANTSFAGQTRYKKMPTRSPASVSIKNLGEGYRCQESSGYMIDDFRELMSADNRSLSEVIALLKSGPKFDRDACFALGKLVGGRYSRSLAKSCPVGMSQEYALLVYKAAVKADHQISNLKLEEICTANATGEGEVRERAVEKVRAVLRDTIDRQIEINKSLGLPSALEMEPGLRSRLENPDQLSVNYEVN